MGGINSVIKILQDKRENNDKFNMLATFSDNHNIGLEVYGTT
jgi:hypothetical protein